MPSQVDFQEMLKNFPFRKISRMDRSITFARPKTFTEFQKGYREDDPDHSLIRDKLGSWKDSWFVIGIDHELDQPIFVDLKQPDSPIFIGVSHHDGWKCQCIADSLSNFITIIRWIGQLEIPPPINARMELLESIDSLCKENIDLHYWKDWLVKKGEKVERFY